MAAMHGNTAAVEVLLEAGLPAKTRSSRGWTAFDEACAARAMEAARCVCMAQPQPHTIILSSTCKPATPAHTRLSCREHNRAGNTHHHHTVDLTLWTCMCWCAGVLARLLQRRELHDAKMTMKQKRAELLDSMRQMPDYSLQVCLAGWMDGRG